MNRTGGGASAAVAPFGSRLLGPAGEPASALRVRLQLVTTAAVVFAHVVGAVVVTALNVWVLPRPEPLDRSMIVANAVAVPTYLVLALAVGVTWGTRRALHNAGWLLEGRPPDASEQRAALRTPLALVSVQAALWGTAVVVFTTIALVLQPAHALNIGLSVVLGGTVTCMAAYLLSEFSMRPLAARALTVDSPHGSSVAGLTARSMLAWALGSGVPVVGLMVVAVLALARGDVSADRLAATVLVLGGTTVVVGLLLIWLSVRAAVDPVRSLTGAVRRVQAGDLDADVVVYDTTEVGLLQAAFNAMIAGLRDRDRVRDLFGRHVGEAVAREALTQEIELGGEVRRVSVLFVDVVGSTELADTRPPHEVVAILNRFFAVVVQVVDEHGGTVNKFDGDGALAIFGAPVTLADHAGAALQAGRAMRDRLLQEVPECAAGIGVSTGDVVAGNVGEERRYEYTVIGDPVNEAARLCDRAKSVDGRLLAAMHTVDAAADTRERDRWRADEAVVLRGRSEPTLTARPL